MVSSMCVVHPRLRAGSQLSVLYVGSQNGLLSGSATEWAGRYGQAEDTVRHLQY